MPTVNTGELLPGMVLARDLRSPQGRLLLPKGQTLTFGHIRLCKRWGIIAADICNGSGNAEQGRAEQPLSPETIRRSKTLALSRFCSLDIDKPVTRELVRQFLLRTARAIENGEEPPCPVRDAGSSGNGQHGLPPLPDVETLIGRNPTLATLPQTYAQIVEVLNDPMSSAAFLAEVISKDSSLSAKLLRLVNSPLYGFRHRVDSLDRAVALVGSNHLSTLALGLSVFSLFKGIPSGYFTLADYCRHTIACGIVARFLAGYVEGVNRERVFALGLLHDIGRLVLYMQYPQHGRRALELAMATRRPLYDVERELWGYDHTALSQALLLHWRLPEAMAEAVGNHHPPFGPDSPVEGLLVHAADIIAHSLTLDMHSPFSIPPVQLDVWSRLGLEEHLIAAAMNFSEPLVADTLVALLPDAA